MFKHFPPSPLFCPRLAFKLACLLALLVSGMLPTPARAHPHAWIDVRSSVVMSPTGMVFAIEQEWLFDELYSAAVLEQMALEHPDKPNAAEHFAPQVMANLEPYGYFMRVTANNRPVALQTVTQFASTTVTGAMQAAQLRLSFTATLAEPVDPVEQHLVFSVFDPTYFIHMSHLPDDSAPNASTLSNVASLAVKGDASSACRTVLKPAKPSPDMFARALALDRNAAPQEDLGVFFAEQVQVLCK